MRALGRTAAAVTLMLACAPTVSAHPMNVAYADVTVREHAVDLVLSVNLFELDLLLALDRDGDGSVDDGELALARQRILDYLRDRVSVASRGAALPFEAAGFAAARGADGRSVVAATIRFPSGEPLSDIVIRCEPLTELGPDHRTLARIARDGAVEQFVFQHGVEYRAANERSRTHVAQFARLGVLHIFTGYDHVLFLLGLLLVSSTLGEVLKIVTSFTVAHSITLSLAVLGVVSLPPRLVEAGIAASICYVALENLAGGRLRRRWLISLGFGLVHGFGFASVVAEMRLPRAGLVSSLLAFNAGVEVGQVAIVLAAVPVLRMVRRTRACGPVITSASALILAMGVFWLYQRAL